MPLNLPRRGGGASAGGSGNEFVSPLRYRAADNVWSTWDDVARDVIEVPPEWTATVDLAHIRTGWLKFAAGQIPDYVWDVAGARAPAPLRPSKDHRRGFGVYLMLDGFGARELCSSSAGMIAAITAIYDEFEIAAEARKGLLPVVQLGEAHEVESPAFGVFWEPTLEIVSWSPRPRELPLPPAPKTSASGTAIIPGLRQDLDDDIPF